ncbi:MAG: TonB-dependent receptor domain-containing protein [Thiobacillus sp.]
MRKGEAGAFYRSNGDAYGGNFSATVASETLNVTYNGSTAQSGNYRSAKSFKAAGPAATNKPAHWLDGDEVGSSLYKSINHQVGFALKHDNHLAELKLGVQDIPYQGFPNQRMDMTGNDSTQINLRYKGQYEWGVLEARAYEEKTRHKMQFGDDKQFWYGTAPGMPMDTEGKNTGALVKADFVLSARDLLRMGGEIQQYSLNDWWPPSGTGGMSPNKFWNIKDGERDRYAVFGEWEARWSPQWLSQFGVRHETVKMDTGIVQGYNGSYAADAKAFNDADRSRTDNNRDLTALARYTPDAMRTVEFGYAQKTRSPNLYERYSWSTGGMAMRMINMAGDGNGYVGNLGLKPEVAHTLSATFDWHDAEQEKWGLKITPYYTHVDDYIDVRRCSSANSNCGAANQTATTGFVYLQFVNQSARLYGLDIAGYLPLAKTGDYGSFTATGLLSYINGENRTTGDNLYNIMPLNAKLALVQRVNNWTHTAEVQLVDAKENVSQVRNEVRTAGYGLLNLRSSYAWKQARFDIGIDNVLNRFYNLPLGGAYVGQGQTMSGTAVPWGVSVPGMGRSIYTGLTVKF